MDSARGCAPSAAARSFARAAPRAVRGSSSERFARARGAIRPALAPLRRALFDSLFRAGRRLDSPRVQVIVAPASDPPGRIGYVIGAKQMPRAVDRNRLRRVLREAMRSRRATLVGLDVVIRLRRACARSEVEAVASEAVALLDRLDHANSR